MSADATLVSVVDDDESVRESLPALLAEMGFDSKTFASAQNFLESGIADKTHCLILDIAMPGMSGPELRRELVTRGYAIPTILISATHSSRLSQMFEERSLGSSNHSATMPCSNRCGER